MVLEWDLAKGICDEDKTWSVDDRDRDQGIWYMHEIGIEYGL